MHTGGQIVEVLLIKKAMCLRTHLKRRGWVDLELYMYSKFVKIGNVLQKLEADAPVASVV
jgi:hypothetical protein